MQDLNTPDLGCTNEEDATLFSFRAAEHTTGKQVKRRHIQVEPSLQRTYFMGTRDITPFQGHLGAGVSQQASGVALLPHTHTVLWQAHERSGFGETNAGMEICVQEVYWGAVTVRKEESHTG